MLCDECGQNQATIHIAAFIGGKKKYEHLCAQCWQKRAGQQGLSVGDLLSHLLGAQPQQAEEENPLRCDVCGETYQEFQKTGRLGCAHCYAAFGEQLEKTLKSIHGHAHHVGKVPPYLEGEVRTERELDELRRQMDQAVQDEEFEQAARLRNRIRELTREQDADSGSADQKEGNADAGE